MPEFIDLEGELLGAGARAAPERFRVAPVEAFALLAAGVLRTATALDLTTGVAFGFVAGAGLVFATFGLAFFAAVGRFAGAEDFLDGFGAAGAFVDFVAVFATTRKFAGFVASIPMTRR